MAKKYHPDVNKAPNAAKKFSQINEAYETLNDENKRAYYDMTGMTSNEQDNQDKEFKSNPFTSFFTGKAGRDKKEDFRSFEEIMKEFDQFFNMERAQSLGTLYENKGFIKGKDVDAVLKLSFDEAYNGTNRMIEFDCNALCKPCKSTGIKAGEKEIKCSQCDGTGFTTGKTFASAIEIKNQCEYCQGSGKYVLKCLSCNGKGLIRTKVKHDASIPSGIYDSLVLRLAGRGNQTTHGRNGDLLIYVNVEEHEHFKVDKNDIKSIWNISVSQALLGGKITVKTMKGDVNVTLEPGTKDGTLLTLKGYGMPRLPPKQKYVGNHIIELKIEVPTKLTKQQKELVEQFQSLEDLPTNY